MRGRLLVEARHRQWLVEQGLCPPDPKDAPVAREPATFVRMACRLPTHR